MIQSIHIQNYAIIDELDLRLGEGLNIITGETGAGKSILLGALGLILGQRADSKVLHQADKKCIIEVGFDIKDYDLEAFFHTHDLDYESPCIIRRELSPTGKSRAFINDTPCNLQQIKALGMHLVKVHSQHETLALNEPKVQFDFVDTLADLRDAQKEYTTQYNSLKRAQRELADLQEQARQAAQEQEFKQFQFDELVAAQLDQINQEQLESELNTLEHAEQIKQAFDTVDQILNNEQQGSLHQLNQALLALEGIRHIQPTYQSVYERLESTRLELDDIAAELNQLNDQVEVDPQEASNIQERLSEVYRLQHKHGKDSVEELLALQDELDQDLQNSNSLSDRIDELKASTEQLSAQAWASARALHQARLEAAPQIAQSVEDIIHDLGMPHAQMQVDLAEKDSLDVFGCTHLELCFTSNKGMPVQAIHKVASGGELSRLMLAFQRLLADKTALPTMIFDEIDTGVSGEVAAKMGQILKSFSNQHQLLCITHLPQVASQGNHHFFVYKETDENHTFTRIKALGADERLAEIAKMLSGDSVSASALANARELLGVLN